MSLITARDARYRMLDVWRGVACLLVVVYHAGFALDRAEIGATGSLRWMLVAWLRMGSLGVPFFFVISGYCIAASADANRARELSAWSFLRRRFRRIYPAYWVAMIGVIAMVVGLDAVGLGSWHRDVSPALNLQSPGELGVSQWVGNITLTETWRPLVWGVAENETFTRVAWTLCHEEQFYLVCFVVLAVAPRRLYGMLAAVSAVVIAVRVGAWYGGWLDRVAGTFIVHWHEFAAGLAVYWRLNVAKGTVAKRAVEIGLAAMFGVGLIWAQRATAGAAGFALMLIPLRSRDGWADGLAPLRFLSACGRRCYSIYLAHLPVCTIVVAAMVDLGVTGFWSRAMVIVPVASVVATGIGWLFFDLVEVHFQPAPRRPAEIAPRPVPVGWAVAHHA